MENQGNSLHNLELQNFILNLVYFVSTCVTMNEPADQRPLTGKSAGPETSVRKQTVEFYQLLDHHLKKPPSAVLNT